MTQLYRILISLISLCFICSSSKAEYFKHLSLAEGLSQPSVLTINKDALGRMWFGTREGLNIYDGSNVVSYKGWVTNSQVNDTVWIGNEVHAIVNDRHNNLFCMIDNDIIKYDIVSERFTRITDDHNVNALAEHDGTVMFMTSNALYAKAEHSDSVKFLFTVPSLPKVTSMSVTDSIFYISTVKGLYAFDRASNRLTRHAQDLHVYSTFIDSSGNVWINAESGGLYRMRPGMEPELMSTPAVPDSRLGSQQTREAIEDEHGNIWYSSFSGLFCYNPSSGDTRHIELPTNAGGLTHPSIFAMFHDDNGTIWAGSYYGGVNYFTPQHDDFINYIYEGHAPGNLYHSFIIDMVTDRDGNLWFGTDGAGVCCVDSLWNIKEQLTSLQPDKALRQNNIKSMVYDKERNRLYIGTHLGGLSSYDINTRRIRNFINEPEAKRIIGDVIHHLKIYNDTLYISSRTGISAMDLKSLHISKIETNIGIPYKFDISPEGDVFAYDLYNIYKFNLNSRQATSILHKDELSDRTTILCTDTDAYFTSLGYGLYKYDYKSKKLQHFTTANSSLPSDYCYNLCADESGRIFITTDGAIVRFNPDDESFVSIEFSSLFPESRIIAECGLLAKNNGTILIGSTKGITTISTDKFGHNSINKNPGTNFYFSRLTVLNEAIYPNDGTGVLKCALPYAGEINLHSDQNSFSVHLSLSDYINPQTSHKFQYRMDGVDNAWLSSNDGDIHYTNLNPGHYTLRARYSPDGKTPGSEEIALNVIVHHPWYTSWWAYLIYLTVIAVAVTTFLRNRQARMQLHTVLEKERFEKHQIEKLNHEKLVFFTNVSHEFQTPLTLIISHIDLLMAKYARNLPLRDALKRVRSHAEQMSHLITQLLEFRKIQQNHQKFHIAEHNAAITLSEVANPFMTYAQTRDIQFSINLPKTPVTGYYDSDMISKVLVNLISNAFKYTPDGGEISADVTRDDNGDITFRVSDTGRGISPTDINHIFDRFYNGSANSIQDLTYKSTGIGLAFARSIVEKHQGTITVDSQQGQGSTFKVTIPATADVFSNDPNAVFDTSDSQLPTSSINSTVTIRPQDDTEVFEPAHVPTHEEDGDTGGEMRRMLIVEDNTELSHNMSLFFSQYFKVECAANGREGLEAIRESNPDIIISDVMMPEMSGTEMCRMVKADLNLCHIPIILLTALSSTEHTLDGLNANADDYITKPFDTRILLARVDNLLRSRRMLQNQFDQKPISEIDLTVINPLDRDLLKRTSDIIDNNLSNSELDIPLLCRELGISRSLFYNKFKALTGMTPNSFILNYRLKHAASLLETHAHISIAEVSDRTGFSTTMYFSRCFKKQYGVPPQQYQKNTQESKDQ